MSLFSPNVFVLENVVFFIKDTLFILTYNVFIIFFRFLTFYFYYGKLSMNRTHANKSSLRSSPFHKSVKESWDQTLRTRPLSLTHPYLPTAKARTCSVTGAQRSLSCAEHRMVKVTTNHPRENWDWDEKPHWKKLLKCFSHEHLPGVEGRECGPEIPDPIIQARDPGFVFTASSLPLTSSNIRFTTKLCSFDLGLPSPLSSSATTLSRPAPSLTRPSAKGPNESICVHSSLVKAKAPHSFLLTLSKF